MWCVGDALGLLHVMEVPRSLRKRMHSESKGLATFVQREVERLDWLAASAKAASGSHTKVCCRVLVFLALKYRHLSPDILCKCALVCAALCAVL